MKTKHIFYSAVFAAALASCSQDAFEVAGNNAVQDLSIRPELGVVELIENAEVATRFATGTGAQPVFADGDKLGACIMDTPKYPGTPYDETDPAVNYQIEEFYSSNNAFTLNEGVWKVDQPMVEGNYLFYAPYNQAMQLRTPFSVAVPAEQDASTEKKALDDFYASGSVVRVGYNFLAAEGGVAQKPKVTMNDVFAYPMITIKNSFDGFLRDATTSNNLTEYKGDIQIDKIELKIVTTAGVDVQTIVGGQLSNANVAAKMAANGDWAVSPMATYTTDLLAATGQVKREVITTLNTNRTVKAGESEVFYAVMPAVQVDFSTQKLQADIYVTIDEKQYVISTGTLGSNKIASTTRGLQFASLVEKITLIKGQKYPQEELNFENGQLTAKKSAGTILTLELVGGKEDGTVQVAQELEATGPEEGKINNNEEFIALFQEELNGTDLVEGTTEGFVFADNTTAEINSELIDALFTYNNKGTILIKRGLPISADVKVTLGNEVNNVLDVTFESANGNKYVVKLNTADGYEKDGDILKSKDADGKTISVCVPAEKTWTVSAAVEAGNICNYGTIEASEAITADALVNNGTITIEATAANIAVTGGTGVISMDEANAAATVVVTGGTQEGIYVLSTSVFDKTAVAAAEAIEWVNSIQKVGEVTFSADVVEAMENIKTVHATSATFAAGEFDMTGKTVALTGASMVIKGAGKNLTTVENLTIVNGDATNGVELQTITATGTYTTAGTGKITTAATATWNGAAAE